MARRWNHYDLSFEMYLRDRGIPYIAVDETRRALLAQASLKSMDYIVYGARGQNLLVEVKGRKARTSQLSENWVTADDLISLRRWEEVFGKSFRAVMVFAYDVTERTPALQRLATTSSHEAVGEPNLASEPCFTHQGRDYIFHGVWMEDYERQVKVRSSRWETLWAPAAAYREVRFSMEDFLVAPVLSSDTLSGVHAARATVPLPAAAQFHLQAELNE
ncbi:hypothetical protein Plim_3503 [Planctopirus limnophila DSM 3776]|uniref:Uncharacterized protein n=1 Tax=Planctopirus limnophila (strain ATCC 43296 / DSM 3776 / IFAM 1008 / Mu 290) TaxID=521674 RepID=D5SV30_PLAL2|nr:HYExAFE family protein [Planctopirus limnophila]ADG69316.1 hypothetical protein Plim_3503 [Planctopirus limnophila DSM 3776]